MGEKRSKSKATGAAAKNSTYKTTRVVVADSLGVSESFQERIGLQDDVFHVLQPPQHKKGVRCTRVTCEVQFLGSVQVLRLISSTWTFDPPPDTLEM